MRRRNALQSVKPLAPPTFPVDEPLRPKVSVRKTRRRKIHPFGRLTTDTVCATVGSGSVCPKESAGLLSAPGCLRGPRGRGGFGVEAINRIRKSHFLGIAAISTLLFLYATIPPTSQAYASDILNLSLDPTSAMFSPSLMVPGDVVYSGLEVSSSDSMELRYAMTITADDTSILDEQLDLTIDVVSDPGADGVWYTADDVVSQANIYGPDGVLASAAIGDPSAGAQTGDRTLVASGSERLRFKVTLPIDTDNSYQGTSCTVSFVFDAEETANNP